LVFWPEASLIGKVFKLAYTNLNNIRSKAETLILRMRTDRMNDDIEGGSSSGGYEGRDRREGGSGRRSGGMGMNPNYFLPKPVKVGDEVEVTVEAQASRGDGIAKKDGFVIFIKGAKEGDKLKVRITEVKARFAIGEVVA